MPAPPSPVPAVGACPSVARCGCANYCHRGCGSAAHDGNGAVHGRGERRGDFASRRSHVLAGTAGRGTRTARRAAAIPAAIRYQALGPRGSMPDVHDEVVERHRGRQQIGQHADRVVLAPDEIRRDHGAAREADDPEAARNRRSAGAPRGPEPAPASGPRTSARRGMPTSFHGVTTTPKKMPITSLIMGRSSASVFAHQQARTCSAGAAT